MSNEYQQYAFMEKSVVGLLSYCYTCNLQFEFKLNTPSGEELFWYMYKSVTPL